MPNKLKWIARIGNIGAGLLFLIMSLLSLGDGKVGLAFFLLLLLGLTALNFYIIEKSADVLSEESWLKAKIR